MSLRRQVIDGLCDNRHQLRLLFKLFVVMGVLLSFSIVYLGVESLTDPIVVLDVAIIGAGLLVTGWGIRYCTERE